MDGTSKKIYPNGDEEITGPDGKITRTTSRGKIIEYADGTREEHHGGEKLKFYTNGMIKRVMEDGTMETRWPDGQIRVKNSKGVILHEYKP